LPHTDARFRPDLRALEEGNLDLAGTEKHRLEEEQRARRKVNEANGTHPEAYYFKEEFCPESGETFYCYCRDYW